MYKRYFKRFFDVVLSLAALPFWLLLLAVVAPLIYLEDKGPILYNAPRLGKDGKIFRMYKFRSMNVHAPDIRNEDGSTFNSAEDPRVTRIGHFLRMTSLDETPQLLNVLKGEMSLIGPRPDLPEHLDMYVGYESRKLEVRPGVTGLSQSYYRNSIPWKQRIQHDIFYIDHLTLFLDVKIFLKTLSSVLLSEGIFVEEGKTIGRRQF